MRAMKSSSVLAGTGSRNPLHTTLTRIGLCRTLALLVLAVSCGLCAEPTLAATSATPPYELAFASFSPINSELFVADADGSNAKPLLPHAGFDGNASFSHDGKWIVFTSERDGSYDIYRARPDGSGLQRLVDNSAYDDQAALSPDGKRLAFVSNRAGQADIWILELATKKLRNVTNHTGGDFRPAWSPDGKWLAFTSDRDSPKAMAPNGFVLRQSTEIYLIRADGTGLRRITQSQAFNGSPTWSPDGKQLLFYEAGLEEVDKIKSAARARGTSQIAVIDLATSEHRVLTIGPGEKWSPRFQSADHFAYVSGGPEGGLEFIPGTAGARGEIGAPSWSPDGRRMLFHRDVEQASVPFQRWHSRDPRFRLVRTGAFPAYDSTGTRLLVNDIAPVSSIVSMNTDGSRQSLFFGGGEKTAFGAVWSRAGDRVAFALGDFFQMIVGPAIADIALVNRDGSGLKLLTDGSGNFGFPSWSPDGGQIVYRASGKDNQGLLVMTLATGAVRALTPGSSHDNFPSWSPKGDRIAFTRFFDKDYELYTVKSDGTDVRRLTNEPGNDAHCAWSPDGEWIAFSSVRGGFKDEAALHPGNAQPGGDIYVMRADGTDVRQLTDTPFEEATVGWAPLRR